MTDNDVPDVHLTDEQLAAGPFGGHLGHCADCRARVAAWQNLTDAAHVASQELVGEFRTPSFDDLLGAAVGAPATSPRVEVDPRPHPTPAERTAHPPNQPARTSHSLTSPRPPRLAGSWRLAASLAVAQLRLLPRATGPLTVAGFAGSVVLAVLAAPTGVSTALFGLAVTLVVQAGTLTACSGRADPRLELMATLPISPTVVFASRLVVVLGVDTVLALAASVAAAQLGVSPGVSEVIASWLGQAMFASAVGVVCAVWRSTGVGAAAGAMVWLLGAMGTFSTGGATRALGSLVAPLWTTAPATLVVAALLLVVAVPGMGRPHLPASPA